MVISWHDGLLFVKREFQVWFNIGNSSDKNFEPYMPILNSPLEF